MSWMIFRPTYLVPTVSPKNPQKLPPFPRCFRGMFGLGGTFRATGDDYRVAFAGTMAETYFRKGRNDFGGYQEIYTDLYHMVFQPTCGKSDFVEEIFPKQMHETIHV